MYEMACFLSFPTWRWTSFCCHAVTSPAVLFRYSLSTWEVVPQLQFIDRVCFFVVNSDRYPQDFLDKVVCRPGVCNDRFRCLGVLRSMGEAGGFVELIFNFFTRTEFNVVFAE